MSFTPARRPFSSQSGIHTSLHKTLARHSATEYAKPLAEHNYQAFEYFLDYLQKSSFSRLFLDSGCGTGQSTRMLARDNPDVLVVGIDRSLKRLGHSDNLQTAENCLLLRADCEDFWRLLGQHKVAIDRHYLLYPNPYPKASQLNKRWHGHAVFPTLLILSPVLEVRTNWEIYMDEFIESANHIGGMTGVKEVYQVEEALTAFEQKYNASGHKLWRCILRKENAKESGA